MKRWIGSLALACVAAAAMAQAPFTIVRPVDGSRVREKVHVLIPKGSIPSGGYIGVFLDGKFIEATKPPLSANKKYYEYIIDTKGRHIADTQPGHPLKLELVLYVDYNEQPRIVDRSSVDINIGNKAGIPIPSSGIHLRYKFVPGTELIYTLERRIAVDAISEAENKLGGIPAELPVEAETIRMLYAVDNAYSNGDGLVRIQPLPEKGKDYAILAVSGSDQPTKFMDYEMAPIYMRIHPTGQEVFGSIPLWFPMQGTTGESVVTNLFSSHPLPTLPTKPVQPGDAWQSRFQLGHLNLANPGDADSVVSTFPARGEFVGIEWERGHPCALIRNTIAAGTRSFEGQKLAKAGANFSDQKISLKEDIWFALDSGKVMKVQRDETLETKGNAADFGFGTGGGNTSSRAGGAGGYPGGPGGYPGGPGGYPGGPGGYPGGPGGAGGGKQDLNVPIPDNQQRRGGMRGGRPGAGVPMGPGGYPGGYPGGPGGGYPGGYPGAGRTGAAAQQQTFVRIHLQQTFTLEG